MSGGHFDYAQYRINDIIDSIEREIERATCERPPLIKKRCVSVYEITGEHSFRCCFEYHFHTFDEAVEYFTSCKKHYKIIDLCEKHNTQFLKVEIKGKNRELEIRGFEYEEYENGGYYPDYSEETLCEFKNAIYYLKKAQIYAQRIDWLISGDDGEKSFHVRLKEELDELKQK